MSGPPRGWRSTSKAMKLTYPQWRLLARLTDEGPFTPRRGEWATFRSLEAMGMAQKIENVVAVTDAGRLWLRTNRGEM